MRDDTRARVPFAAIGVLLLLFSSVMAVYLSGMQSAAVSRGAADDRDRDVNAALTIAMADMGRALNYAGMYAFAEVGKAPVINVSGAGTAKEINRDRTRKLAFERFCQYLEANYNGSHAYGDYHITVRPDGGYQALEIGPGNMTLARNFDHPVIACRTNYTTYEVMSIPVVVTVEKNDDSFTFTERRQVSTLITSRYPLLEEMTEEYAERLNGSALFTDLTAAAYAYTWTRGYAQYAFGTPLNIVDNGDMELMANGAVLLEQGFEYNSVDPISLAALVYQCAGSSARPSSLNNYSVQNNSRKDVPENKTGNQPERFNFSIDAIVDRAHDDILLGDYAEYTLQGAYTVKMFLEVSRDGDYYPRLNETKIVEETPAYFVPKGRAYGFEKVLTRTFRVYVDNSTGYGYADRVTVTYVMSQCSVLQYLGEGRYSDSIERIGDPVLQESHNDVAYPTTPYDYDRDLSFGHKRFTDDNLRDVVTWYEESFDARPGARYFNETLRDVLNSRADGAAKLPYEMRNERYDFVCGPDNRRPIWAEIEADYEIDDLAAQIKSEVRVSLDPAEYGGSPSAMANAAYAAMYGQFSAGYDAYLGRADYITNVEDEHAGARDVYRSCGAKAIYRIRLAFLEDVRQQLHEAVNQSGADVNATVDRAMKDTGLNSSDLGQGASQSKNYLGNTFYIQFGLGMKLNSSPEFAGGYPWTEDVTLALDQSPDYLGTAEYRDPETGYLIRPLKLRNICLFAVPAGNLDTGQLADVLAAPILDGIDAIADAAVRTGNETVLAETDSLVDAVANASRDRLKAEIAQAIREDPDLGDSIAEEDVDRAVDEAYARRGNDSSAIVKGLNDGSIESEVTGRLINESAAEVREKALRSAGSYADEYVEYAAGRVRDRVKAAEQKAITGVVDGLKGDVKALFRDFSREAAASVARKGSDLVLEKALARVPSGVPLLPPYGWWATMNVWYVEVQGEIPSLTAYDADTEPVPNPVFGHEATCYTRRWQAIHDQDGRLIGWNEPVRFCVKTCTFILVPPGAQGIGDKAGDWDEKSPGFSDPQRYP